MVVTTYVMVHIMFYLVSDTWPALKLDRTQRKIQKRSQLPRRVQPRLKRLPPLKQHPLKTTLLATRSAVVEFTSGTYHGASPGRP